MSALENLPSMPRDGQHSQSRRKACGDFYSRARKQELMVQAARIAKLAYDRVEDQIDVAPLPQAVVTAGIFTDKFQLLSGDVTAHAFNLNLKLEPVDLVAQFERLHAAIDAKLNEVEKQEKANSIMRGQLTVPTPGTIADSGAETDLQSGKGNS